MAAVASSGDAQVRFPNTVLPGVLVVGLVDDQGGPARVSGVPVQWEVTHGGGQLLEVEATTSGQGIASARFVLGELGGQEVSASVAGFPDVRFSATAVPPGPIAFVSNRRGVAAVGPLQHVVGDLFVMAEDGTDVVMLFSQDSPIFLTLDAAWSPEGLRIAFARLMPRFIGGFPEPLPLGVHLFRLDDPFALDGHPIPSTGTAGLPQQLGEPTWAPSGLAIAAVRDSVDEIYKMDSSGNQRFSISGALRGRSPAWSPLRNELAVACDSGNRHGICLMGTRLSAGDDAVVLFEDDLPLGEPAWSPDGEWLLFSRDTVAAGGIWMMHRTGSEPSQVLSGAATTPAWGPEGRRFAVSLTVGGQRDIYVVDLEDGSRTNLTRSAAQDRYPSWRW